METADTGRDAGCALCRLLPLGACDWHRRSDAEPPLHRMEVLPQHVACLLG